jgi:hypothetical protein
MLNPFKRKFKNEYKQAINYQIAHPEQEVLCPRCRKPLVYFTHGNSAGAVCLKRRCIRGDSRGNYGFHE